MFLLVVMWKTIQMQALLSTFSNNPYLSAMPFCSVNKVTRWVGLRITLLEG